MNILDCSLFFHISKVGVILMYFTVMVYMDLLVFTNCSDFSEFKSNLQNIEVNTEQVITFFRYNQTSSAAIRVVRGMLLLWCRVCKLQVQPQLFFQGGYPETS